MSLLTSGELSKLPGNEWIDGRWYYAPYEIARAQLAKVIAEIETLREQAYDPQEVGHPSVVFAHKVIGWLDAAKKELR